MGPSHKGRDRKIIMPSKSMESSKQTQSAVCTLCRRVSSVGDEATARLTNSSDDDDDDRPTDTDDEDVADAGDVTARLSSA